MRRRRALQAVGGILTGTLAGCTAAGQVFETYRHVRDAPIDESTATTWRWDTLGHDARRRSYAPYGSLPSTMAVDVFDFGVLSNESQPAFVDGTAYFGGSRFEFENDGTGYRRTGVIATDGKNDGWIFPEEDPLASPTVVGDAVFVSSNGMTRALDRRDGTLCWEYEKGTGYATASSTAIDGTLYVTGGRIFSLSARTGEVRWATDRPELRFRGTAATADGVFATTGSEGRGMVYRFDPETGETEWATSTSSDVRVPPVLGDRLVYVVEVGGWLRALDPTDGSEAWSRELGGRSSAMPALREETVFAVATNSDTLYAFDGGTGDVRWQFTFDGRYAIGPTVADDAVYLPTSVASGGLVHELGVDTGAVRGVHELPKDPTAPLVIGIDIGLISAGASPSARRLYALF